MTKRASRSGRAVGTPAVPEWRPPSAEFLPSFDRLRGRVRKACAGHSKWEERVVAGVHAALAFAADEPAAAHALTIDARRQPVGSGDREDEVVEFFAELLRDGAPAGRRIPIASGDGIIESIATVIRGHLLAGTSGQLVSLAPDLIYLTLMPYTGSAGAQHWANTSLSATKGT
jgi:hypothetical protein